MIALTRSVFDVYGLKKLPNGFQVKNGHSTGLNVRLLRKPDNQSPTVFSPEIITKHFGSIWLINLIQSDKHRIEGHTRGDNIAMRRVFKACGWVLEGYYR